jgi:hypothetical protein
MYLRNVIRFHGTTSRQVSQYGTRYSHHCENVKSINESVTGETRPTNTEWTQKGTERSKEARHKHRFSA